MAGTVGSKIKVMRSILEEFKKRFSMFSSLDKNLLDSESFLKLQIADLDEEFRKAKRFNTEIIELADEEDVELKTYKSNKTYEAIQNIFFKHSTTLHEYLTILTKSSNNSTFVDANTHFTPKVNFSPSLSFQNQTVSGDLVYLNGLVPEFHGCYGKWPDFMDAYVCNVHENEGLSDGSKVKILQSLLKNDALKVVKREFGNFKTKDYTAIWEKLKKRYNHKRTIIYSYFKELCFQPQFDKENSENLKLIYDTTFDSISSLKSMGLETDKWGDILLFLVYSKLPLRTKEIWNEKHEEPDSLPKFETFLQFLEKRFRVLEGLEASKKFDPNSAPKHVQKKVSTLLTTTNTKPVTQHTNSKFVCKVCNKGSHPLRKCFAFKKLKVPARIQTVISLGYCLNCFSFSHQVSSCTSEGRCDKCKEKHNSLLCTFTSSSTISGQNTTGSTICDNSTSTNPSPSNQSASSGANNFALSNRLVTSDLNTYSSMVSEPDENESIVFPTALIKVISSSGQSLILRAMIDNCSDASYITENAVNRLRIPVQKTDVQTTGLGNTVTASCVGFARFNIVSTINQSFVKPISAYVLSFISPNRPVRSFQLSKDLCETISLADPTFNQNARIDLLLGGLVDATIHKNGSFKCKNENVVFRETELGWIASGSVPEVNCFSTISSTLTVANSESLDLVLKSLDTSLRQFWEIEEIPNHRNFTEEELLCERHYDANTKRLASGRYSVCLPFKDNHCKFSDMRKIAFYRFAYLEKKLLRNPKLRDQYIECMQEYLSLNHMTVVNPEEFVDGYYIPHHSVLKESSSTTKLRVVFDASAKDSNAQSLNDNLYNGPRLQSDLLDHLIRFRTFKIAFTSDVAKMYRQIIVHPKDRKYQLILWRSDPSEEVRTYCLNTVTFGTKTAPYLAVKTLLRVARDEQEKFPKGCECISEGFYVDDCIYGADSVDEAIEIQSQTIQALRLAGFHLRKWSSNSSEVLEMIPESDRETKTLLDFDAKESVKTLGVQWSPAEDNFRYTFSFTQIDVYTKRNILSDIARIFDPLGWLSPCLITAKLLLQSLWSEKRDWDEPLSHDKWKIWSNLRSGLEAIAGNLKIPRWLHSVSYSSVEVHGFSDASASAYSVAIYLKSIHEGEIHTNLICAKTKVAPLKTVSIPRLELMAAVMLAKLVDHVKSVLKLPQARYFYWSDSQISLAWIRDFPHKRKVFVANRITEIQSLCNPSDWHYVDTNSNPSDLGTRGVNPHELPQLSLWWKGPSFLQTSENLKVFQSNEKLELPKEDEANKNIKPKSTPQSVISTFLCNRKPKFVEVVSNLVKFSFDALNKYSTLSRLVRVVAFCLRFLKKNRSSHKFITPKEYDRSLVVIIRMVQEEIYGKDIEQIQSDELHKKSSLYSLNPFMNSDDRLLRVSGRLQNASHLSYDQRHPIILPYSHIISRIIVRHAHTTTLHGTEQQTTMLICQRYHIVRCKKLVKAMIHSCVRCFRQKCVAQSQLMGQLPSSRITPSRPFLHCGVDFAGPFHLKKYKGRCQSFYKGYFALFVCCSTKAVHLEAVIDLSTPSFIAAFRRFIGRRGLVSDVLIDKNMPPNSWLLCRVCEVHPGTDGLVRVVTLQTKTSIIKRPVTKICPLPIQTE